MVGNVKGNGWNADDTQYKYEFGGASPYDNPEFGVAANKSIQYRGNSGSDGVSITRTAVVQYR